MTIYTLNFEDNAIWVDAINADAAQDAVFSHMPTEKEIYAYCNEHWPINEGYERWENVDICWAARAKTVDLTPAMTPEEMEGI